MSFSAALERHLRVLFSLVPADRRGESILFSVPMALNERERASKQQNEEAFFFPSGRRVDVGGFFLRPSSTFFDLLLPRLLTFSFSSAMIIIIIDAHKKHLGWNRSGWSSNRPRLSARAGARSRRRRCRRRSPRCSARAPRSVPYLTACPRTSRRQPWSSGARSTCTTCLRARPRAKGACAPPRRDTAASPASSSTAAEELLLLRRRAPAALLRHHRRSRAR